ncbi:oxidoreductase [Sediminitomix flava]|uniref:NAD(P)-dependent dehydrogenase (Short-subunit alcohol dehydrogenase family) n=1 Tax=Sediminitomix flava TaxID=379075 RepID=A0A315Z8I3_SEDFL|nr:oxidoreductase [Sediminitomix flava]PWJ40968.1 NAD(P)-dependent dehydrogenase (short-subunit alcohol dehydrogenase family) [Sediminitomix flava]
MEKFNLKNFPNQKGRIAIVTGANIGLGYETARALVKKEATVIMACRNEKKAQNAIAELKKEIPNADLVFIPLNLSSAISVRAFVRTYLERYSKLDLLINNAGIMVPPFSLTEDGYESQMGVNYFNHFLLTMLLLPTLNQTEGARVVTLSSIAHRKATIDFENLNSERDYQKMKAYGQSKLACLMFAYELDRKLKQSNSKVLSVAAHPGVSTTNLAQHLPSVMVSIFSVISPLFAHNPEEGARPTLLAALGQDVKGGEYFGPTGFREMKGEAGKVSSTDYSHDKKIAARLWEVSEELTKESFSLEKVN